jgi:hypothetical protein
MQLSLRAIQEGADDANGAAGEPALQAGQRSSNA